MGSSASTAPAQTSDPVTTSDSVPVDGYDRLIKVILSGPKGAGRSSLLLRFVEDVFTNSYIDEPSGIGFNTKTFTISGKTMKLLVWDFAGRESFHFINSSYYRAACCSCL